MARLENNYVGLRLKWDSFINTLISGLSRTNLIDVNLNSREFTDTIYDFLTKNKFDDKGFDFVWKAVKIDNPKMTKKQFLSKYIHQTIGGKKINILDNIDNKATTDRIVARLKKTLTPLQNRVERLTSFKLDITPKSVENRLGSIRGILNTNKTTERAIRGKIQDVKSVLARKGLTSAEKKNARRDLVQLRNELKLTQNSNKKLTKTFNTFNRRYTSFDDVKLKKEFTKLIDTVSSDIIKNQQKVVIEQTMRSSASYQVKRVAQTEYVKNVTQKDVDVLTTTQDELDDNKMLLVKWELSADHNITDICDDYANEDVGYGKGVYPLDASPIPVSDTHPFCKCRLVEHSPTKKKSTKSASDKVTKIYNNNFPSRSK